MPYLHWFNPLQNKYGLKKLDNGITAIFEWKLPWDLFKGPVSSIKAKVRVLSQYDMNEERREWRIVVAIHRWVVWEVWSKAYLLITNKHVDKFQEHEYDVNFRFIAESLKFWRFCMIYNKFIAI